ncbi:MAG: type 1 glutamine amidotransferase [bacterium]|nr:type 1 glutamine amidotransferase [bacterium]
MTNKPVLFLQNITIEGPGRIKNFLLDWNIPFHICDLYQNETPPDHPADFCAIVALGGPMNVDEEDRYPFLAAEKQFLRRAVDENVPVLGVCLGGQLLARALGAVVTRNPRGEIGWLDIELTSEGRASPFFEGLPPVTPVFQWHGDAFAIPDAAVRLAGSAICANQAFSYGDRALGLQFHLEVDENDVAEWAKAYLPDLRGESVDKARELIERPDAQAALRTAPHADRLLENFFRAV